MVLSAMAIAHSKPRNVTKDNSFENAMWVIRDVKFESKREVFQKRGLAPRRTQNSNYYHLLYR
jgi:hypothetical protein